MTLMDFIGTVLTPIEAEKTCGPPASPYRDPPSMPSGHGGAGVRQPSFEMRVTVGGPGRRGAEAELRAQRLPMSPKKPSGQMDEHQRLNRNSSLGMVAGRQSAPSRLQQNEHAVVFGVPNTETVGQQADTETRRAQASLARPGRGAGF